MERKFITIYLFCILDFLGKIYKQKVPYPDWSGIANFDATYITELRQNKPRNHPWGSKVSEYGYVLCLQG